MATTRTYIRGANNPYYEETILRLINDGRANNDRWKGVILKDELNVANGEQEFSGFSTPIRSDGDTWEDFDGNLRIPNEYFGNNVLNLVFENLDSVDDIDDAEIYTPRIEVSVRHFMTRNENNPDSTNWVYLSGSTAYGSSLKDSLNVTNAFNGGFGWSSWNMGTADFSEDSVNTDAPMMWDFRVRFHYGSAKYTAGYTDEFSGGPFITSNQF